MSGNWACVTSWDSQCLSGPAHRFRRPTDPLIGTTVHAQRHERTFPYRTSWEWLTVRIVNPSEQATLDALVAELDAALAGLDEPPVRDHSTFVIEPSWHPDLLAVKAERDGAADLMFIPEGDWIRVDIAALSECLALPVPGNTSRAARKEPPLRETLARLLRSRATVTYGRRRAELFLTDEHGRIWCRNKYWGVRTPPTGIELGEPHQFTAVCPKPAA